MFRRHFDYYYRYLDHDIPAGVVVFLVAVPLCLGIAVASGAPPFSGIIAGIVGGLIVSILSGSQLSVSGPAAGLTVIVANAVEKLGFDAMLLAVALAGLLQVAMGFLRAGVIGAFFPSAVIKGMLAAIGLILIMKQLPHAVGYDADAETDLSFLEDDSHTRLFFRLGRLWFLFDRSGDRQPRFRGDHASLGHAEHQKTRLPLAGAWPAGRGAIWGGYNIVAQTLLPSLAIAPQHLVNVPAIFGPIDFAREFSFPDYTRLIDFHIYVTAATFALVGSLETLLSLEAVDKLDPLKRIAPTNQELKAQGVGNFVSGMLGGLPITAVIVRSSASIDAGAHTKAASFFHGLLLLLSACSCRACSI